MTNRLRLMWLSLAFACTTAGPTSGFETEPQRKPSPDEPPVAPPSASVDTSGPLEVESDHCMLRPSNFAPLRCLGFGDEPEKVGWSRLTGEFVVCAVWTGGDECQMCDFHRVGGEPKHMGYGLCDQYTVSKQELARQLEVGDFRIEDGRWAYGADVVLVVAQRQGKPDQEGMARGVLQIGARLRSEDARVAWIESLDPCHAGDCSIDIHIDAIAPAPDGQTIAVLMHSALGAQLQTYPLRLLDARLVAAAAYNGEGLERLQTNDFEQAAVLFERAADIDLSDWKGPYNLACAHARAGKEEATRAALTEAIRRGGETVRATASKDQHLDSMRARPWFSSL